MNRTHVILYNIISYHHVNQNNCLIPIEQSHNRGRMQIAKADNNFFVQKGWALGRWLQPKRAGIWCEPGSCTCSGLLAIVHIINSVDVWPLHLILTQSSFLYCEYDCNISSLLCFLFPPLPQSIIRSISFAPPIRIRCRHHLLGGHAEAAATPFLMQEVQQ